MFHAKQAARRIDVGYFQAHYFGDPQSGAVRGHQGGAIAESAHVAEERVDFRGAEDYGKLMRLPGPRHRVFRPYGFQRFPVQKLHGRDKLIHGLWRLLPLVEQMQLVGADIFEIEKFGAELIKFRQSFNVVDVVALRLRREVAELHVFRHAST